MAEDLASVTRTSKYPLEAFIFVQKGLEFTVRQIHGEIDESSNVNRHVSGRQLCLGLRDLAVQEYGLLARAVLRHWHITRSDDFGHIVFAMIDAGLMQKTDDDHLQDFINVLDFTEAFTPTLQLEAN